MSKSQQFVALWLILFAIAFFQSVLILKMDALTKAICELVKHLK